MSATGPNTARILVVDDNEPGRYAKARLLAIAGFEVLQAATGEAALRLARSERPELMLIDVRLPDINGRHVAVRLREDPETAGIAILQTSATHTDTHHRVMALEAGADAYLAEPVEPEELIANVRALIRMRRAEARLLVAESRFREMSESIGDVFWILDPVEMRYEYLSPAFELLWGRPVSDAIRDPQAWLDAIHPDDRRGALEAYRELVDRGEYNEEFRIVRPDGSERWIANRGFPMQGAARRVAGVAQDITGRKLAERKLQLQDRRKDEFLAMLAHELRNPLGPIRNAVEVLREGPDGASQDKAREMIGRQVNYLGRIVDDLLDVSRITQGRIVLRKSREPVAALVEAAMELVRPSIAASGHRIDLRLPPEPLYVEGDAVRLTQVIGNLLGNAAKFTPPAGRIKLTVERRGAKLRLEVSDTGVGMTPELLADVFDLFVQGDQSLARSTGGLGVGLSLVKRVVELHGGTVQAASEGPGRGSCFAVELDLAEPPAAPQAPPEAKATPGDAEPGRPRRILVVDDSRDSAEAFSMVLQSFGHEVEVSFHPHDAIAKAKAFRPEVIFLDIGLPDMDGYTLAGKMRELPEARGARMLALTGYGQAEYRERALRAGFDEHLVKPLDPGKLPGLIG